MSGGSSSPRTRIIYSYVDHPSLFTSSFMLHQAYLIGSAPKRGVKHSRGQPWDLSRFFFSFGRHLVPIKWRFPFNGKYPGIPTHARIASCSSPFERNFRRLRLKAKFRTILYLRVQTGGLVSAVLLDTFFPTDTLFPCCENETAFSPRCGSSRMQINVREILAARGNIY